MSAHHQAARIFARRERVLNHFTKSCAAREQHAQQTSPQGMFVHPLAPKRNEFFVLRQRLMECEDGTALHFYPPFRNENDAPLHIEARVRRQGSTRFAIEYRGRQYPSVYLFIKATEASCILGNSPADEAHTPMSIGHYISFGDMQE